MYWWEKSKETNNDAQETLRAARAGSALIFGALTSRTNFKSNKGLFFDISEIKLMKRVVNEEGERERERAREEIRIRRCSRLQVAARQR